MLAPDVGGVAVPLVAIAGVLVVLYVVVTWNARVAQDDAPVAAGAVDPIQLRRKAVHICIGNARARRYPFWVGPRDLGVCPPAQECRSPSLASTF